jgi:hypothetical protein
MEIILVPSKKEVTLKPKQGEGVNFLSMAKFEELEENLVYVLLGSNPKQWDQILMQNLLITD